MFKEWLINLLAVREDRVSALVFGFFIFSGFALYQFASVGEINESIKVIIINFLYLIGGVNISSDLVNAFGVYVNKKGESNGNT